MSGRRRYRTSGPIRRRKHRWSPAELPSPPLPPAGNVWTFPREIDNDVWIKNTVTVVPNLTQAPDQVSTTADLVREDANNSQHRIDRDMDQAQAGQSQVFLGYVKPAPREYLWVRSTSRNGTQLFTVFHLTGAGSVVRQDFGHLSSIWLMPNGFYAVRVHLEGTAMGSGSTLPNWRFTMSTTSTSLVYQGLDDGSGMYFWDIRYYPNTQGTEIPFPEYEVQNPNPPPQSSNILRVGWFQGQNVLGRGAGDAVETAQNPRYRAVMLTPNFSDINAVLETCEELDILIVCNFARSRNNWIRTVNGNPVYFHSDYEAEVSAWTNHAGMRLAVNEGRVVAYCHDEPNHPDFGGTLSPFLFNEGNRLHKDIWSTIITTNRVNGRTLTDGWDGFDPVEYDGCDYGWLQYAPQHTPAGTPAATYAEHKALLDALNMGMIPGLNWINGGHTTSVNNVGVNHCWDYNNDNVSNGIVIGSRDAVFSDGQKLPCGTSGIDGSTIALANPGWVRACIDAAMTDPDAPFFLWWQHPGDTQSNNANHVSIYRNHPDMIAAMRYAVTQGNARQSWNGWRTPKPVTW